MAKRKAAVGASAPTFEEALARLETIVRELEEADLPLERSLTVFEEGVRLSRLLHERLNEAERKVEILMKNEAGEKVAVPFATGVAADDADEDAGDAEDDAEDDGTTGGSPGGHGQSALPF
ncbi:MAG: exodeoxyribonuclease VII small subunit [Candidatus Methylomirabilia bacterium]